MSRLFKLKVHFAILAASLLLAAVLQAQPPKDAAPIPAQIGAAKKVFISNAGQDDLGGFSGGQDRTYNQFYAAMKTWGQYELVSTPADADLVLDISFAVQAVGANVIKGDSIGTGYAPRFRLLVLDPKTHFTLWAFTDHVPWALFAGNRDKNFDQGIVNLLDDLKKLAGRSPSAADSTKN
jgi:hypothetical protein